MPAIYLRRDLYDEILKRGSEPSSFVNRLVEEALWKRGEEKKEEEKKEEKKKAKRR